MTEFSWLGSTSSPAGGGAVSTLKSNSATSSRPASEVGRTRLRRPAAALCSTVHRSRRGICLAVFPTRVILRAVGSPPERRLPISSWREGQSVDRTGAYTASDLGPRRHRKRWHPTMGPLSMVPRMVRRFRRTRIRSAGGATARVTTISRGSYERNYDARDRGSRGRVGYYPGKGPRPPAGSGTTPSGFQGTRWDLQPRSCHRQ